MSRMLLALLSVLTVVSFQNCGQSGEINLQSSSEFAKVAAQPNTDDIIDPDQPLVSNPGVDNGSGQVEVPPSNPPVVSDPPKTPPVPKPPGTPDSGNPNQSSTDSPTSDSMTSIPAQEPAGVVKSPTEGGAMSSSPNASSGPVDSSNNTTDSNTSGDSDVSHGSISHGDSGSGDDDIDLSQDEPNISVDENDGTVKGPKVSCAGLNKLVMSTSLFVKPSNMSSVDNVRGSLKIADKDQVDISNFRGLLFLMNIKNVGKLSNIRSMLMSVDADHVGALSNVRALSLMNTDKLDLISNYRGILCLGAANTDEISNFRGVLEVTGNIKKISNFRGILKVKGNIEKLENFRGVLKVDGDILSQSNVKVNLK